LDRGSQSARMVMPVRPGVEVGALSDVGCHRENNEDRYSYWEPTSDEEFVRRGRLAILADGMGGYEGGQEASRIAVETIEKVYADSDENGPRAWLAAGFRAAHQRILQHAVAHPEFRGMGTTCTAVAVLGSQLYYAHVGDSRLYLCQEAKIYRLTRDHSYVGRLVEQGIVSPAEAASHPQRHILTAALGAGAEVSPESPEEAISLGPGDGLVLCTDGLWSLVSEAEIADALAAGGVQDACARLVNLARQRGGPDNITVQILRMG
jgi:serine/threonine protein phosphatase PrpC